MTVTVQGKPGVTRPASLMVTFTPQSEGKPRSKALKGPGGTIALSTRFVLRADGYSGQAKVEVKGLNAKNAVVAYGQTLVTLVADRTVSAVVELTPSDFLINSRTRYSQLFSTAASGRQLAADSKGNFVVLWEDYDTSLTSYDIWYRLFDSTGQPKTNGATAKNTEYPANETTAFFDYPAVDTLRGGPNDGNFVTAYIRSADDGKTSDINIRSFWGGGKPNSQANGGKDLALTTGGNASRPDIAATIDGTFLVVWQETDSTAGTVTIKSRLLGFKGAPLAGSKNTTLATLTTATIAANPTVVGGKNGGFMVAYNDGGTIKATVLGNKKDSFKVLVSAPFAVAKTPSGKGRQPAVVPLVYGYGVAWTDDAGFKPDTDGSHIRFRRFDFVGKALAGDYILNTTTSGNQQHPAGAALDNGLVLVAWTNGGVASDDPSGGVRGRAIAADGMPVGPDFRLNTTTTDLQSNPSVAPHSASSFVVAFVDNSKTAPDTDGSAIRGRVVYPEYNPTNGEIGAKCDATHLCKTSDNLICQKETKTGDRCLSTCTGGKDAQCAHGGVCSQDPKTSVNYCSY